MNHEATVFRTLDLPGGSVMPFSSLPGELVRVLYGRIWLRKAACAMPSSPPVKK